MSATLEILVYSYKKAQVFKRDFVRIGDGKFLPLRKHSANHSLCVFELADGDSFDARGSIYAEHTTKWTATKCQSWARFRNEGGRLVAYNFDGDVIPAPAWVRAEPTEIEAQKEGAA